MTHNPCYVRVFKGSECADYVSAGKGQETDKDLSFGTKLESLQLAGTPPKVI